MIRRRTLLAAVAAAGVITVAAHGQSTGHDVVGGIDRAGRAVIPAPCCLLPDPPGPAGDPHD